MTPSVLKYGPFHSFKLMKNVTLFTLTQINRCELSLMKNVARGIKKQNTNSKNPQPGANHYNKCHEECVVCEHTEKTETLVHVKCKYSIFVCWTDTFWV